MIKIGSKLFGLLNKIGVKPLKKAFETFKKKTQISDFIYHKKNISNINILENTNFKISPQKQSDEQNKSFFDGNNKNNKSKDKISSKTESLTSMNIVNNDITNKLFFNENNPEFDFLNENNLNFVNNNLSNCKNFQNSNLRNKNNIFPNINLNEKVDVGLSANDKDKKNILLNNIHLKNSNNFNKNLIERDNENENLITEQYENNFNKDDLGYIRNKNIKISSEENFISKSQEQKHLNILNNKNIGDFYSKNKFIKKTNFQKKNELNFSYSGKELEISTNDKIKSNTINNLKVQLKKNDSSKEEDLCLTANRKNISKNDLDINTNTTSILNTNKSSSQINSRKNSNEIIKCIFISIKLFFIF